MKELKIISFSGAATKIAAHAAIGTRAMRDLNFKPDIMVGISSGALVMLPLVLGKYDLLKEMTTSLTLDDIFDFHPVNSKGKIRFFGYVRGLLKGAFGSMNHTQRTIKRIISEDEFARFKHNPLSPVLYVGLTSITTGRFELVKLNDMSYQNMLETLVRSSTIPIYTDTRKSEATNEFYADGGLRYHNAARLILKLYGGDISQCLSIFSRPQTTESNDWGYNGKSIGRNVSKTFELLQNAISENDEEAELNLAASYNVRLTQVFAPKILKGVYDVDSARLGQLYMESFNLLNTIN